MKKYTFFIIGTLFTICLSFFSCTKNDPSTEISLAANMLADKTWYLEYKQKIVGDSIYENNYIGQSTTYFINFLKNQSTTDSDGISGSYKISRNNNQLQLLVNAKTTSGYTANYSYDITSIGAKKMILTSVNSGVSINYYYSTQKNN
jgi:hypothetical protein